MHKKDTYAQRSSIVDIPTQVSIFLATEHRQTRHKLSDEFK